MLKSKEMKNNVIKVLTLYLVYPLRYKGRNHTEVSCMTIKEMESITGIAKQNIRFYEKKGLIQPGREGNDYRCYSQNDAEDLLLIKMLRKLDMPLEDIKKVMDRECSVSEAVKLHEEKLQKEENRLQAAIQICREIQKSDVQQVDAVQFLRRMEEIEAKGGKFMNILKDYKKVGREESAKSFSFVPDNACMNPTEFSIALSDYARENNLELIITNEGMYPEFEINGVKYTADRAFGRMGAVVRCRVVNEKDIEGDEISDGRRKKIRLVRRLTGLVMLFAVILLFSWGDWWRFFALCFCVFVMGCMYHLYRRAK